MFIRFFYDTINIIRRAFYYGKTKETCTSCTNDRRKTKILSDSFSRNMILRQQKIFRMLLKNLLGGTIKEMMEAEMDEHLGYEKSERSDNDDYRNGYKRKQVNSRYGSMEIEVPQDRKSTFEPQVVKKRQKDTRGVLSIR